MNYALAVIGLGILLGIGGIIGAGITGGILYALVTAYLNWRDRKAMEAKNDTPA